MGILNINDLKPGMVLDQPVRNKQGMLLLDKGSKLAKKHIMIFKAWGVTETNIKGFDRDQLEAEETKAVPVEIRKSVEADLKAYFVDFGHNDVMKEIFRIARKFMIKGELTRNKQGKNEPNRDLQHNK